MPEGSFLPQLSASTQAVIRSAYGVLMMATLLQALPEARRFFVSERWGGYAKSSRDVDAVQNPAVMALLMAAWFAAIVLIVLGWWRLWAALVNLALCRYFFIHMRWKGILRGMGAPASWRTGRASPSFCSSTPAGLRRTSAASPCSCCRLTSRSSCSRPASTSSPPATRTTRHGAGPV